MCWRKLEVGGRGGPHLDLTTALLFNPLCEWLLKDVVKLFKSY